ncbi:MAG: tetratricopeptide repeat protein [Spirochaetaceae bacterium]
MQLPGDRFSFSEKPGRKARRRKRVRIVSVVFLCAAVGAAGLLFFTNKLSFFSSDEGEQESAERGTDEGDSGGEEEDTSIDKLWEQKDYVSINEKCAEVLEEEPLSARHLLYNGFAFFYRGANQYSPEDQIPLFDKAIINLRKLLVLDSPPEEGKIHYVLGKAYYHKGRFYLDLAVEHLEESVELGFTSSDTFRYLGLALGELSSYEESIEAFLRASESGEGEDPILHMTIGQTYYRMDENEKALEFLNRSAREADDTAVEQRSRFLLGKIYMDMEMYAEAGEQYEKILEKDSNSADAHYHLGEIFELQGDRVKARAEWRKALNIEPSHYGALLKLY